MDSKVVIQAENLTKVYRVGVLRRSVEAVTSLNLNVFEGEVFAFLGLNGAGKTTTIKLLLGHARPTFGRTSLFGISSENPQSRFQVGYLPDLPHFYNFLSSLELLDYAGKLFGLEKTERTERSKVLIKQVGLEGRENEPLRGFSRGMLQRVGLAQALINNPKLLILDEPLGGLDPAGRAELRKIIMELKDQEKTIFFSSHILDDAQRIADRVGIINSGRLVALGTLDELLTTNTGWEIRVEPIANKEIIRQLDTLDSVITHDSNGSNISVESEKDFHKVLSLASQGIVHLKSIEDRRSSLEDVFLQELSKSKK